MEKVIVVNSKDLEKKKNKIRNDGKEKLHVLSDFDRTLTKCFVGGKKIPSLISVLRDEGHLGKDYSEKAHALFEKYHPIEMNSNMPIKEKKKAMHDWWSTHFDLLLNYGINKQVVKKAIDSKFLKFRGGALDFFDFLNSKNIPLIILSSSGLGEEAISMFLEKNNKLYKNISVISNSYLWNKKGKAIKVKEPIIHVMNKDETMVHNFPVFKKIKNRKNVLLLGDSLGDIGMIKGFDYDNLIKIGFLNMDVKDNLEQYKKEYDILILHDSDMKYVNKLIKDILK